LILTEKQRSVFDLLEQASASNDQFGEWYLGALHAVQTDAPDSLPQAAHSIREITDRLPSRVGIPAFESPLPKTRESVVKLLRLRSSEFTEGWLGRTIDSELAGILDELESLRPIFEAPPRTQRLKAALERRDPHSARISPVHRKARDKVFRQVVEYFQKIAHHNASPDREEFLKNLALFEDLIRSYLSPVTVEQQIEILALIGVAPTAESQQRLSDLLIHNGANLIFVLQRLAEPQWLPFLVKLGLFSNLRPGEQTEEGYTTYRADPALSCLARLTPLAPEVSLQILEGLPASTNPQIPDQIMRCIAHIDQPSLIPRCLKLLKKLPARPGHEDWIWIGEILAAWSRLGMTDSMITLIGIYVRTLIQRQNDRYGSGTSWQFGEIDRNFVGALIEAKPKELAATFFRALLFWKKRQIEITSKEPPLFGIEFGDPEGPDNEEPSAYWLEDFRYRTSRVHELEQILATRLFEIGSAVFDRGNAEEMSDFENLIRSDSWDLFARLRWQLYAKHPEKTCALAKAEVLLRIGDLGRYSASHGFEMAQMLEAHSTAHGSEFLNPVEVEQIYQTVMAGPIGHEGEQITEEPSTSYFRRKQLYPIRELLTGQARAAYEMLAAGHPGISMSSYKPFSSGGEAHAIEHVAPPEAAGMASMSDEELWRFLNEWTPKADRYSSDQWWVEEHVSALGPKFADLLEAEPDHFISTAAWWQNLTRPVVLYKPLERAATRISTESKDGVEASPPLENEWRNWFGLASWIADQAGTPAQSDSAPGDTGRPEDRDWNWPRIIAVKFLAAAIDPRFPVPEDLRPEIGRLLRKFVEDSDPRLAAKDQPMMEDWLTTAINSVRGTALEDLLNLGLKQKKESSTGQPEDWIFDVIHAALVAGDQSPAVFAIMGSKLPLVLYLYGEKFKVEPGLLLPEQSPAHRNAFLLAQVRYGNPLGGMLEILPNYPTAALDCLVELNAKAVEDHEQRGDFGGRLGSHLAYYYWNEEYSDLETGMKVLDRYFQIAKPSQRSRAIRDIGRIFSKAKPAEDHESLFKLVRDLWDRRFSMIEQLRSKGTYKADDVHEELSAFIDWLGCECHPFEWRHDRVISALQILDRAPQAAFTIRTLNSLSQDPRTLGPSIEILETLIAKESGIVSWTYRDDEMKPILARGLASPDQGIQDSARRVQEILLRHGLFEYLELESLSAKPS
jgi:hypothetical protein